jgi:hypothetical protein
MRDLFYSSDEGILFWVAGYTKDGNTNSVVEIVESLNENATNFAEIANIPINSVFTLFNTKPPRYQYMRIFYAWCPPVEDAFVLSEGWTMSKWITT